MRRYPQQLPNYVVHRERDRRSFTRLIALLCCGILLTAGFVHAAGRHFAAVQLGYHNEQLRQERSRLLEEQRRLLLAYEEAASPVRLEQAARRAGLQPARPMQVEAKRVTIENSDKTAGAALPVAPALIRAP